MGLISRWLSQSLVVSEIALAFVLLSGGAVLVSELYRLTRVSPGFDPEHLLTFQLTFSRDAVPGKPTQVAYQERLIQEIAAIPGVGGAAIVNQLPLNGCCFSTAIFPEGALANPSNAERVAWLPISTGYFRTMRIPIHRGRLLDEHDTSEKLLPVMINEAAVRRYWPNQEPVGAFGHFNSPAGDRFQVVGVVGDVKNNGLDNTTVPEIYLPSAIVPPNPMNFAVRSSLPEKTLVPEVRRAIQKVNPGQPIHDVKMMSEIARDSLVLKRVASYVMMFFALAALLMAAIGSYGVVSYSVRLRTVELGTRMALGAVSRDLLTLVVGSGLKMAAYGSGIGMVASFGAAWLLLRQFGILNPSLLPFAVSVVVIAAVALAASFFPAWGATRLSPMVAIRNEPASMWQSAREGIGQLFEGLFRAASGGDAAIPADASLMTEFIEASRRAASFREALGVALESLRSGTGAPSALLLEGVSAEEFRSTTAVPDQSAGACSIPRHGLLASRLRFHSTPLPIAAEDYEVWRRWAAEYKPAHLAEIESLRNAGARLAVPLRTNKEMLGVVLLGPSADGDRYGQAATRLLRDCANHFALMLENARLTERIVEHKRLQRDLALAAEVQKRLLPRQSLETAVVALAAVSLPARSVGGDYYDFLDLPGHRTAIALADVAGKGVAAALIMSVVQASLRVISSDPDISLPQLAAKLNHFLYRSTGSNSYATFFYAQLEESKRELRYVNAGHNPPYLLRADASAAVEELATGGTIIGMFPQARYEEGTVELRRGDVLAVFTDGVTEALNPREEEFGEERLKGLLGRLTPLPVEEMSSRISQELKDWIQDAAQYDDLTFVLMKVK
jgi:serine phosphatase RsbU (regulator of sigma subunit)